MAKPNKNKKQEQDKVQTTTSSNGRRQAENKGYTGGAKISQSSSGSSGSSKTNRNNSTNSAPATRTSVQTGAANTRGRSGQTERGGVSNTVSAPKIVAPAAAIRSNPLQSTQGVNLAPGGSANALARAAAQAYENRQNRRNAAYSTLNRFSGSYNEGEDSRMRSHRQAMSDAAFDRYASTFAPSKADVAQLRDDPQALRGIAQQKAAYDYTKRYYGDWLEEADKNTAQAAEYKKTVDDAYAKGYITKAEYDSYTADVDEYLNMMKQDRADVVSTRNEQLGSYHDTAEMIRAGGGYSGGTAGDDFNPYSIREEYRNAINANRDSDSEMIEKAMRQYAGLAEYYDSRGDTASADEVRQQEQMFWERVKPTLGVKNHGPAVQTLAGAAYSWYGGIRGLAETDAQVSQNAQANSANTEWRAAQQEADRWLARWQDGEQGAYGKYLEAKSRADAMAVNTPVDMSLPGQQANLRSQAFWNATKEGMSEPAQIVTSAAQSVIQQLPFIALGVATGGAATAAGVGAQTAARLGAAASVGGMSTMAAGNYMTNATAAVMDADTAFKEGLLMGGVEALTEYMAVGDIIKYLVTPTGRSIWKQIALTAAEEGIEEMAAEPLDYGVQFFYRDPNASISLESVLEAGITGALAGIGLGGMTTGTKYAANYGWRNPEVSDEEAANAINAFNDFTRTRAEIRDELLREFVQSGIDQADAEELADYYDSLYGEQYEQAQMDSQSDRISEIGMLDEQRVTPQEQEPPARPRNPYDFKQTPQESAGGTVERVEDNEVLDIPARGNAQGKPQEPAHRGESNGTIEGDSLESLRDATKDGAISDDSALMFLDSLDAAARQKLTDAGYDVNNADDAVRAKEAKRYLTDGNREGISDTVDKRTLGDLRGSNAEQQTEAEPQPEQETEQYSEEDYGGIEEEYGEEPEQDQSGADIFDRMDELGKTLGENGRKALAASYDGDMPPADYFGGFAKVYNAARGGMSESEARNTVKPGWMDNPTFFHAFSSGVNDRKASDEKSQKQRDRLDLISKNFSIIEEINEREKPRNGKPFESVYDNHFWTDDPLKHYTKYKQAFDFFMQHPGYDLDEMDLENKEVMRDVLKHKPNGLPWQNFYLAYMEACEARGEIEEQKRQAERETREEPANSEDASVGRLLMDGALTIDAFAKYFGISPHTVREHLANYTQGDLEPANRLLEAIKRKKSVRDALNKYLKPLFPDDSVRIESRLLESIVMHFESWTYGQQETRDEPEQPAPKQEAPKRRSYIDDIHDKITEFLNGETEKVNWDRIDLELSINHTFNGEDPKTVARNIMAFAGIPDTRENFRMVHGWIKDISIYNNEKLDNLTEDDEKKLRELADAIEGKTAPESEAEPEEEVDSGETAGDNVPITEKEDTANDTEDREDTQTAERVRGEPGDVSGERMPEDVDPDGEGRDAGEVSGDGGRGSVQSSGGQSDTAGDRGSEGTRDVGDSAEVPAGGVTEQKPKRKPEKKPKQEAEQPKEEPPQIDEKTAQDVLDEIAKERETMAAENPRGENFVIGESLDLPKGEKARILANLDAIRIAKELEKENRLATDEEKIALSKYVGWGGLSNIFAEHNAKFGAERGELRELLTDAEYDAARHSTENAYYTSIDVIRAMYDVVRQIGFRGGRVLEPSSGSGNFVGAMPADLAAMSRWSMVELDDITGLIAKHLYPQAKMEITGFQDAKTPENYYDMLISNVPFSEVLPFTDSRYDDKIIPTLHDYFFVRGLDVLRPGGLMAFITSAGTMDKANPTVRNYLSNHADLLGAIRLPNTAFSDNAGTDVVTDIIFLRKRVKGEESNGIKWNGKSENDSIGTLAPLNEYFAAHPEMVLGRQVPGKMYTAKSVSYAAIDTETPLADQIRKAGNNITGRMAYDTGVNTDESKITSRRRMAESKKRKRVARTGEDGKVHIYDVLPDGSEVEIQNRSPERTAEMMEIGKVARELIDAQQDGAKKAKIDALRKKLNELYDAFATKYGSKKDGPAILNSTYNLSLIKDYEDSAFILALEDYDAKTKTAKKARIFFENTVSKFNEVKSVDNIRDAIIASINKTGALDIAYMAGIYGKTEDLVKAELVSGGLAFEEADGTFTQRSKYLSGNVRAKLRKMEALAANEPRFKANVEALREVIPKDLTRDDISLQPGATWIPIRMYESFVGQFYRTFYKEKPVKVIRNDMTNEYKIIPASSALLNSNSSQFSTIDMPFLKILDAALNGKTLRVFSGTKELRTEDTAATAEVQAKVQSLKQYFQEYMLYGDEELSRELVALYNDIFNCDVLPEYDGSNLTIPGISDGFELRTHQANAVQRIIEGGGNTLLAHRVGAGKTLEMAAAAVKLRQLGLVKKPTFVVPKHLVGQWGKEFLEYFPAAKVLVLREDSFNKANRDLFLSRIMTGDYDAIIMSKEQFSKIPVSVERQARFIQMQIDDLDSILQEEAGEQAASGRSKRSSSVKNIEKAKDRLQKRLEELTGRGKADHDAAFDFENLGIDSLFVDEAHNYKNLFYNTKMDRISGLGDREGSGLAFDMYMKTRFLQELNGGKGLVFATATPIMNSVTEIYHMQRFLQEDLLLERGIRSFDAWCSQFGEIANELQMKVSGGYEEKTFLSKLRNLPELQMMFRSMADVVLELPDLKIPKMRGGKMVTISAKASREQISFLRSLAERVDALKNVDPKEDNMLKITSDGRKAAYTRRYFMPEAGYEPDGKIVKCAEKIVEEWKASEDILGTQLVFLDMSTPKAGEGKKAKEKPKKKAAESEADEDVPGEEIVKEDFDSGSVRIYQDLKEMLIARGIPAEQIAFVQDAKNNKQRNALFKKVREGKVRVLLGSTATMGTGMNVQQRGVALHHLDAPWRPGDIEQRNGRFIRQYNMNKEVAIYAYVTEQSFDARLWDMLQRKSSFINKIMSGTNTERSADSGDTAGEFEMNAADIKSIASGDPRIAQQFKMSQDLKKAIALLDSKRRRLSVLRDTIQGIERDKRKADDEAKVLADFASRAGDISGENFKVKVGNDVYTDRKEAGEAFTAKAKDIVENDSNFRYYGRVPIGFISDDIRVYLELDKAYSVVNLVISENGVTRNLSVVGSVSEDTSGRSKFTPKYTNNEGQISTNISNAISRLKKGAENARAESERLSKSLSVARQEYDSMDIPGAEKNVEKLKKDLDALIDDLKKNKPANAADEEEIAPDGRPSASKGVIYSKRSPEAQWHGTRNAGNTEKARPLTDITQWIIDRIGIPINTGKVQTPHAMGEYHPNWNSIREKTQNDMPTISHEIGHWLDNRYSDENGTHQFVFDILTDAARQELVEKFENKDAYEEKQYEYEGFAEFVRQFLTSREDAAEKFPVTYQEFRSALTEEDLIVLDKLGDMINAVMSGEPDTNSLIRRRGETVDYTPLDERIREAGSEFYQSWVDSNHAIRQLVNDTDGTRSDNAYILATNAQYAADRAGAILTEDMYSLDGRERVTAGLSTVLKMAGINMRDAQEYQDFGEYLIVRHAPERMAEGMQIFADPRADTPQYAAERQAELEKKYKKFRDAADALYNWQRTFLQEYAVKSGLVSKESAAEWAERWKYYVPLQRYMGKKKRIGNGTRKVFANRTNGIRKAKGSGRDIYHPVDNIIEFVMRMTTAAVMNDVMKSVTAEVRSSTGAGDWMEKVPPNRIMNKIGLDGVKKQLERAFPEIVQQHEMAKLEAIMEGDDSDMENPNKGAFDFLGQYLTQFKIGKPNGNIITVMKNGRPEFWQVNDEALLKSITSAQQDMRTGIIASISFVTRFMTSNITGNNVIWSFFSNAPRDIMPAIAFGKTHNPAKLIAGIAESYIQKAKGDTADGLYKEFLAMGGGNINAYNADIDQSKELYRRMFGRKNLVEWLNPMDYLNYIGSMIESGPRFATYKVARMSGSTPHEAFYAAMDVTVNFKRAGAKSRDVNTVVPFFNASVQGIDKFRRWITADDVHRSERAKVIPGRMAGYFAVSAALAVTIAAVNGLLGDDDDDREKAKQYSRLSNYTKNSHFCIPLGDGKYFAIPKPRELAVLTSLMEAALDYRTGNSHAFDEFGKYARDNFLPPVVADAVVADFYGAMGDAGIFGVFAHMMANRDFMGKPIVSSGLQNLEPKDQYNDRTSKMAVAIARAMSESKLPTPEFMQSPQMIDYFFQQVLGGWWKYGKALVPMDSANRDVTLGIRNQYVKDNQYSNDITSWLYDRKDASEKAKNSDGSDMDKAIAYRQDSAMTSFYGTYYKLAKDETETDKTRGVRETVMDMLYEYRKSVEDGGADRVREALYDVVRETGDTSYLPGALGSNIKDADGTEHTLSAQQYVDYQTNYNRVFWETCEAGFTGDAANDKGVAELAKELASNEAKKTALANIGAPYEDSKAVERVNGAEEAGFTQAEYISAFNDFHNGTKDMKALTDNYGDKISGSLKEQVVEYIRGMDCSDEMKRYLYLNCTNYKEDDCPW